MGLLMKALEAGKICVVDVSQMRGMQSFILAGIVLRRIFDRNQEEFTKAEPRTLPTIAVIEEAQSVLQERASASDPYLAWVKEGRKYDLGALLITQQPGSIPNEILSQGDNWFIFHLLSAGDLTSVKRANAHFSDDLLSSLLNEPIPGQGVFWSSVGGNPYPVSIRALLFESIYKVADENYSRQAIPTFADELRKVTAAVIQQARAIHHGTAGTDDKVSGDTPIIAEEETDDDQPDLEVYYQQVAISAVRENEDVIRRLNHDSAAWGYLVKVIKERLPDALDDRNEKAYQLVRPTIEALLGSEGEGWHTLKHSQSGKVHIRKGTGESH